MEKLFGIVSILEVFRLCRVNLFMKLVRCVMLLGEVVGLEMMVMFLCLCCSRVCVVCMLFCIWLVVKYWFLMWLKWWFSMMI